MLTAEEAKRISEANGENELMRLVNVSIRQIAKRGHRHVNLVLNEKPDTQELIRVHAWLKAYGFGSRSRALDKYFHLEIWW